MRCRRAENVSASLLLSHRVPRPVRTTRHARFASNKKAPESNRRSQEVEKIRDSESGRPYTHPIAFVGDGPPPKKKLHALPHPRVAILGGGITGLTTAFYLARKLPPTSKIVVYEADKRWGGWIKSERTKVNEGEGDQEVLLERGPRLISLARPQGRLDHLVFVDIMENLGLRPAHTPPKLPRFILNAGKLRGRHNALGTVSFWKIFLEMLPMLFQRFVLRRKPRTPAFPYGDVSVASMGQWTTGSPTLVQVGLSALMHGVWGGDVNKLSAVSAMGGMHDSYRELIESRHGPSPEDMELIQEYAREHNTGVEHLVSVNKKEFEFFQRFWTEIEEEGRMDSFSKLWWQTPDTMGHVGKHGLESLPLGLVDMLESAPNVELRLGSPAQGLGYNKQLAKVEVTAEKSRDRYDKVISTLPADKLADITEGEVSEILSGLPSVSIMTVNLWYPQENLAPHGVGYLIPAATPHEENPERALGVFFDSSAGIGERPSQPAAEDGKPEYKSEYGTKLFVLMGGHLYERDSVSPPTEEEAIEQAKTLLERSMGIPKDEPCHATASLAEKCLPQHNVGHYTRLTALDYELEKHYENRLAVAGGSYTKPGVAGAMRAGWDIADAVANDDFLTNGLEHSLEPEVYAGPRLAVCHKDKMEKIWSKLF